jgi:MFS family permease
MSARVIRAVLRNPALRRVQLAFLLFNAAEYGTWVAVLLYAYEAFGPGSVGLVALAQLIPAAAFAPVAAALADRFPRQRTLLVGYLLQTVADGAVALGILAGASPWLVLVAAVLAALTLTFTRPSHGALLPGLSRTPEELTAANGLSGTVEGAGVLLGPLLAAGLLTVGSPGLVFAAASLATFVAAMLVVRLRVSRAGMDAADGSGVAAGATEPDSPMELMAGGLRALLSSAETRLIVALLGLRMLTIGAMDVLFVLLALEVFNTGEAGAGILNAALGLGTIVGGAVSFIMVGRQRLAPALAVAALTWGLALIALGGMAGAALAPVVIIVGGIGLAAADVAGRTILQRVADDRVLARVLGGLEGVGFTGLALGSVAAPVLAGWLGPQGAVMVVGALLPVGVAATWLGLAAIDRRVRVPVREVALLQDAQVFTPLAPPQLEMVAGRTRWVTAEPGEVLMREGERGDRYLVLEAGLLQVTVRGRTVNVVTERGDGVGEIALLRDIPRTATVTAARTSVLLAIERRDFLEAVTGHDAVGRLAEEVASQRLRRGSDEG